MELLALNSDHYKVEEQIQVCPEYISESIHSFERVLVAYLYKTKYLQYLKH